jgi:hypothetical protein
MKKVLVLIITFMVIGLTVVSAQSAADIQAMEQLTTDFQAGKVTMQEFQRRMEELVNKAAQQGYQEDTQRNQQQRLQPQGQSSQQQQYQRTYPGATAGWPAASAFRRYGVTIAQPNIQTPHGITYSYKTEGEKLIIYAFKNFTSDPYSVAGAQFNYDESSALQNHFERAFGDGAMIYDPSKPSNPPTAANRTVTRYVIRLNQRLQQNGTINVGGYSLVDENFIIFEIFPDQFEDRYRDFG